ncbi:MAG: HEPN domain-containing protein [Anaerolineae bacterium]
MGKELALEWLESAEADLKTMERTLDVEELTHIIAFHVQQTVEKCLKAPLELQNRPVPKEHSTIRLYGLVAEVLDMGSPWDILTDLDDLYISARYPGELGLLPHGRPPLSDARQFYEFAHGVSEGSRDRSGDVKKHPDREQIAPP